MTNSGRRYYLSLALAALLSGSALSFSPQRPTSALVRPTTTATTTSLDAIGVLARKAKEAEVRKYCETSLEEITLEKVKQMKDALAAGLPPPSGPGPLQQALTRRKGTISVIAEYKRKLDSSGYVDEVFAPGIMSPTFREFGAAAVAVSTDGRTGGCTYDDVRAFADEQSGAKGDIPGPCLVICNDLVVDEVQIARAAAYGADAAVVDAGVIGVDKVSDYVNYARALGMELVVGVDDAEEARAAAAGGARILMVTGGAGPDPKNKYEVVSALAIPEGEALCSINLIQARDNKALEEVEESWISRDLGFKAVWVGDALYKNAADPTEQPGHIIKSMKAKSSVKWASPKARSGKGEGAREYLGDIFM